MKSIAFIFVEIVIMSNQNVIRLIADWLQVTDFDMQIVKN